MAGGLFILPSLAILTALSWIYVAFGHAPLIEAFFAGIKPAVVAIVAFAAYRIGSRVLHNGVLFALAALAFVAVFALNLPFPWVVVGAGAVGYVGGRLAPRRFEVSNNHAQSKRDYGPALIDDHTPVPAHAQFRWRRAIVIAAVGMLAWGGALGMLVLTQGLSGTLTQMGIFFTKTALLTVGGAYAVLPYVYQGAVDHYGWLTALQMIDGLALGETTPGPLIMVVAFVGFVGAWADAAQLSLSAPAAAALGAATATYFTFLPSFLFIFLGAPMVEATRGNLKLTAVLTGITAAVVGVIANLALFFAFHVFWPRGFAGGFAWASALIGAAAAVALFRFKVGIIPVVLAAGLAGVAIRLVLGAP